MARCPRCTRHFSVPEGDMPEEHGCPRGCCTTRCGSCGYWLDDCDCPPIRCAGCHAIFDDRTEAHEEGDLCDECLDRVGQEGVYCGACGYPVGAAGCGCDRER